MNELISYWSDVLKRDIAGFADPGSSVSVEGSGRQFSISWLQRARQRKESFQLTADDDFRWEPTPGAHLLSYRDFLCSERMADLGQLASAISRVFPREPYYVPTTAEIEGSSRDESDKVLSQRVQSALAAADGHTQLFFVKGDAGAGKTTLLKEVVSNQADRYASGESKFLFLLINAQGRALSNLRDALAGELQDLRAGFTRDAVPALVRRGLLVPIIDGFDELLGAAGYGDAFGSLRQFLIELDGHGVLVVSARSSFYDVEFLSKSTTSQDEGWFGLVPITIHPWSERDIHRYLAKVRGQNELAETDRKAIGKLSQNDRSLLGKPFFASRLPEYLDSQDHNSASNGSLLQFLVESYVRRESGKIVDKNGEPLVPVDGHRKLFEETAELMWTNENRRLKTQDLRFLAEMVAEECHLSSDAASQFVTKITSYAGFKTADGGPEREFAFEHEVYFDYFLAAVLRARLYRNNLPPHILDRGVLPETVINTLITDDVTARSCLSFFKGVATEGVLHENLRRNAGQFLAGSFRTLGEINDIIIGSASFVNVSFEGCTLKNVAFHRCMFIGTRMESARFVRSKFEDCRAEHVRVSSSTIFDIDGVVPGENVISVVDVDQGETFSPPEITNLLRRLGAPLPVPSTLQPSYSVDGRSALKLLHKVVKVYQRTTVMCTEDDFLVRLFQDPYWPALQSLLIRHRILREETRPASGTKKIFLRPLVSMPELMRYEMEMALPPNNLGEFWSALRILH